MAQKALNEIKKKSGFTLLELLVVIGVIGVLSTSVMVGIDVQESLNDSNSAVSNYQCKQFLESVNHYITTEGQEPENLTNTYQALCKLDQASDRCASLDSMADRGYLEVMPYVPQNKDEPILTGLYVCFSGSNMYCSADPADLDQTCIPAGTGPASSTPTVPACISTDITPFNYGIAANDSATGIGYIMYSEEDVGTRFTSPAPNPNNADHFIVVNWTGSAWRYHANDSYGTFTPESTDVLVWEVDFDADTVTVAQNSPTNSLLAALSEVVVEEGEGIGDVSGIPSGVVDTDIEWRANYWNGAPNPGEFDIVPAASNSQITFYGSCSSSSSSSSAPDTTPPTLSSITPLDEGTDVSLSANLLLTFSEAVTPVSGNITISEFPTGPVFETISVTSGQVTGGGTNTITVDPSSNFDPSTEYYIEIDASAFDDLAGNSYFGMVEPSGIGIVSASAMDGGDGGFPVLMGARPIHDLLEVGHDEDQISDSERDHTTEQVAYWVFDTYKAIDILDQSAAIIGEVGLVKNLGSSPTTISLRNTYTDPIIVTTPKIESSSVEPSVVRISSVSGNQVTMYRQNPGDIDSVTADDVHFIVIESGSHTLPGGVLMEAGSVSVSGVNRASSTWTSAQMELITPVNSYSTPVVLGQVMSTNDANWQVFWASNGSQATPPTSSSIYVGRHIGADSTTARAAETVGYIIIEDSTGTTNSVAWEANLSSDTVVGPTNGAPTTFDVLTTYESTTGWNFTTVAADVTPPTLSSTIPVDDATDVSVTTNLTMNFSEAVNQETGNITIRRSSDNAIFETIAVTSGQVTGNGTSTIVINPTGSLANSTEYHVLVDATAFDDAAGNSYAGISSTTAWSFTTEAVAGPCSDECSVDADCGGVSCLSTECGASPGTYYNKCGSGCAEVVCDEGFTSYCAYSTTCYGDISCDGNSPCLCIACATVVE